MKFFEWIKKLFSASKELEDCRKNYVSCLSEKETFRAELSTCEYSLEQKQKELAIATQQIVELQKLVPKPDVWEEFYNNKYPVQNITYGIKETDGEYEIDVRNFFQYHDFSLPIVQGKNNDEKAFAALCWTIDNIRYVPDKEEYGFEEYWAFSFQTMKRKKGDCEDGAILMANIMMRSGIPYWRVRLNAGNISGGGHCYVTYCRETDNKFIVLDWCYWANKKPISERPTHEEERNYNDKEKNFYCWFSWNEKLSFGKMQTMAKIPNLFKVKK
jgi:predicted transglutaminase-like cysteine proteinase